MKVLGVIGAALALAGAAHAGTVSQVVAEPLDAIAGAPVACETPDTFAFGARSYTQPEWIMNSITGLDGAYIYKTATIELTDDACAALTRVGTYRFDVAVFILAHESAHAAGVPHDDADPHESAVNCAGARVMARDAYELGLRGRDAFALLWRRILRLYPPDYLARSCVP